MDLTAKPFLTGLLLLVLFFLRLDVSAQDPTPLFKNYSTENGLPSSEVYCCLQDNDRNLWFGTDRGVVRFNGYEFKTFTTKDGLSDNTVFYLCLDSHGRLWMYTFSGRIFYFENEKIFPYKYNNLLLLKSINRMPEGFYVDSTGAITVSILERGAIRFDKNGVMTFLDTVLMTTKPHYNIQEFSDGASVLSITASNPAEKDVFVKHNYSGNVQEYSLRTAESTRFKFIRVNKNKIIFSIVNAESRSSAATQSRENFYRATATSSDAAIRGMTARRDASLTEARSHSIEAGRLAEAGRRYEQQASFAETHGLQISRDLSQNWVAFASAELARNPSLAASGYETWMRDSDLTSQQRDVRTVLEQRFQQSYLDDMRRELGPVEPLGSSGIAVPASTSAGGVRSWGASQIGALRSEALQVSGGEDARDHSVSDAVSARLGDSNARMESHQQAATATSGDIHRRGDEIGRTVQSRLDAWNIRTIPAVEALKGPIEVDATPLAIREGVSIKPGTNIRNLDAAITPAISSVAASSRSLGLIAPTITSGRDRHHHAGSLHPKGDALDFRGHNLTITQGRALAGSVRSTLGRDYDVNFETFRDYPANNHLHVEYDPKR